MWFYANQKRGGAFVQYVGLLISQRDAHATFKYAEENVFTLTGRIECANMEQMYSSMVCIDSSELLCSHKKK